jgi:hypothetical protein
MRIGKLRIAALVLFAFIAIGLEVRHLRVAPLPAKAHPAGVGHTASPAFALLPESETANYAKYYLVDPKSDVQSWEPTVAEIDGLEANLPQISTMSESGPGPSRHIGDPRHYFRQYMAIVEAGKQKIFVNSLCRIDAEDSIKWRKQLEIVYDGGTCYWQAIYDPSTQKFSNLRINGVA